MSTHPVDREVAEEPRTILPKSQTSTDEAQPNEAKSAAETAASWDWVGGSTAKLLQAILFGIVFGFLLQKGGVAKFDILVGVLLLEDFTVVKVMLTAIVVGMIGVYALSRLGMLERQIKGTVFGADIVGGLIFGVGFALLAYCPGTNAAAVGQGNLDALVGVAGLLLGSYAYALASGFLDRSVNTWGKRGKVTLPQLVGLPTGAFVLLAVPVLVAVLILLEVFGP